MDPLVGRIQAYLRASARQRYEAVRVPPFTLFFHPTDPSDSYNYAIPDDSLGGALAEPLAVVRAAFLERGRLPRFEFVEAVAPTLAPALLVAGFEEESSQPLMVCTPQSYRPAPPVPHLTIISLDEGARSEEVQAFITVQRQGFGSPDSPPASREEAERFRPMLRHGLAFLARVEGEAAGAAMATAPLDGVTELVGVATRVPYRRRGVATALTDHALRASFDRQVEVACLTAEDERAGRVYERLGFHPQATMLAFRAAPEAQ